MEKLRIKAVVSVLYEIKLFTENCLIVDEGQKRCIVDQSRNSR